MVCRHTCTHTIHPHISSHLCGVSLPLPFSHFLSSPLLTSCCFYVFPFSVVTNPVPQGKHIPHSKGKKAPEQTHAEHTRKHNHAKHTYANRQRKQAPCPYKGGSQGLVAGSWRLLADHCDPAILAARSQDISAQR